MPAGSASGNVLTFIIKGNSLTPSSYIDRSSILVEGEKENTGTGADRVVCRFGGGKIKELSFDGFCFLSNIWNEVIS